MDTKSEKKLIWNIIAIETHRKESISQALGDSWEPFFIQTKMDQNPLDPRQMRTFDVMWFKKLGDFGDELTLSSTPQKAGKENSERSSLSLLDA